MNEGPFTHLPANLPVDLLSDEAFAFTNALSLPTFTVASMRLLRRVTLISCSGAIERVIRHQLVAGAGWMNAIPNPVFSRRPVGRVLEHLVFKA